MATIVDILGMPFDAKLEDGAYDRVVYSADIARYFNLQTKDGILVEQGKVLTDEFECSKSATSLGVDVQPGNMMIKGYLGWFNEQTTITTIANTETYPRIDNVVIERNIDVNERKFTLKTVQGTPAENPQPPVVENTDTVQQKVIARLRLEATSSVIGTITDVRTDESLCGVSLMAKEEFEQWKEEYTQELDDYKEQVESTINQSIESITDSEVVTRFVSSYSSTLSQNFNGGAFLGTINEDLNNIYLYNQVYGGNTDVVRQGFILCKVASSDTSEDVSKFAIVTPILPINLKRINIEVKYTKILEIRMNEFDSFPSTSKFASCKFYQYLGGVARYISKNISFDDNLRPTCNIETSGSGVSLEDLDENIIISKSNVPESGEVTRTVRYNFSSISNITVNEDLAKGKRFGICFNDLSDGRITMEKFYLSNGDVLTDSDMLEYIRNKGAIFDISMKYSY